jgi:hypothetical protein
MATADPRRWVLDAARKRLEAGLPTVRVAIGAPPFESDDDGAGHAERVGDLFASFGPARCALPHLSDDQRFKLSKFRGVTGRPGSRPKDGKFFRRASTNLIFEIVGGAARPAALRTSFHTPVQSAAAPRQARGPELVEGRTPRSIYDLHFCDRWWSGASRGALIASASPRLSPGPSSTQSTSGTRRSASSKIRRSPRAGRGAASP